MIKLSNDFNCPDDYKSNGCGSGWSAKIIPNTIYGVDIKPACRLHDWSYQAGATIQHKEQADREFLNNMLRLVNAKDAWYYPTRLARWRAKHYYDAVVNFGGTAFWDGKNAAS